MALAAGSEVLVRYAVRGQEEWHARILLAAVGEQDGHDWHIAMTPDGGIYAEDYGAQSTDVRAVRGRAGPGIVPYGVPGGRIYDFGGRPSSAEGFPLSEHAARRDRRTPSNPLISMLVV